MTGTASVGARRARTASRGSLDRPSPAASPPRSPDRPLGTANRAAIAAALLAPGLLIVPALALAQTTEPSTPGAASPVSPASDESTGLAAESAVDLQRQINELRSDLLDERDRRIDDRQDSNLAVVLGLAIVAAIGGLWARARFHPSRAGARIGAAGAGGPPSLPAGSAAPIRALPGLPGHELQTIYVLVPEGTDPGTANAHCPEKSVRLYPVTVSLEAAARGALSPRAAVPLPWPSIAKLPTRGLSREGSPLFGPAMRPDPKSRPNGRGDASEQRLRYEKAVVDCTEAIRSEPDECLHYLERGNALAELDRHEEALADYDRAIGLDPGNAAAYLGRCHAKADLGRHEEAIEDFEEAVRLDPDLAAGSEDE